MGRGAKEKEKKEKEKKDAKKTNYGIKICFCRMPQRLTLSKTHWCSRWPSCVSTIFKTLGDDTRNDFDSVTCV
uniref:Uncharacterized protein n=1 Tax=Anguilla anguilla TaxID=7936 RepID=A0A0E9STJ9_ANGAN